MKTATMSDFKKGAVLFTSEGYSFRIMEKYDTGIWNARGTEGQGDTVLFESEAKFYKIKSTK